MKLYPIQCGKFKLDGGAMFGVVPKTLWQKTNPADENNLIELGTRSLLVEDGKKLILIDCGLGNKQDEKFFGDIQERNRFYPEETKKSSEERKAKNDKWGKEKSICSKQKGKPNKH